jgi:hypothetical protein
MSKFTESEYRVIAADDSAHSMSCDQCEMLSINGVACHETGCPNQNKRWDANIGQWFEVFECPGCGTEHDNRGDAGACCTDLIDPE